MFIRLAGNIIVNANKIVMAERTRSTVKITCTNNDVVTVVCTDTEEAIKSMDILMEQATR